MRPLKRAQFSRWTRIRIGVILLTFLFISLGVVWGIKEYLSPTRVKEQAALLADPGPSEKIAARKALLLKDSDSDGLYDWEELLYQTNPLEKDSDGDGLSDGEELTLGTAPGQDDKNQNLIPRALNDKQAEWQNELRKSYGFLVLLAEGNLTRKLLASTSGLKNLADQNAAPLAEKTEIAVKNLTRALEKRFPKFAQDNIPDSSLRVREDAGPEVLRDYFNAVASLYEKYQPRLKDQEEALRNRALSQSDPKKSLEFSRYRRALSEMLAEILALPVSQSALIFQKKEVWGLASSIVQIELLERAPADDPLYILLLLSLHSSLREALAQLHAQQIPKWLTEQGIVFTKEDKASLLYITP